MADDEDRLVSRQEAIALGLKFYRTGKPCKRGHVVKRRTCDCACIECSKQTHATKRITDRDRIKARELRYRQENREKRNKYYRDKHAENPKIYSSVRKQWRVKNREKLRAKRKENHRYRQDNDPAYREHRSEYAKEYSKKYPDKVAINSKANSAR